MNNNNNIIKYTQIASLKVLFDDSPRNKRSPSSLRQQSIATVGVSVMQCLITLFNHAEIKLNQIRALSVVSVEDVECCYGSPLEYILIAFMR